MATIVRRAFLTRTAGGGLALLARPPGGFPEARAVTSGPRHHFVVYCDVCLWGATGRYLLAHEVDFVGRPAKPGEEVVVGCVDQAAGRWFDLGRFFFPPELEGPARRDLHPRWSRDGAQVCIDSAHEATRQVYVVNVGRFTRSGTDMFDTQSGGGIM